MNRFLLILVSVLLAHQAMAAEPLYRRAVNEKNPGGKDLVMVVEEVRRDPKTSEVKVTYRSGASVPSSMVIMRGLYDIAVARNTRYFIKLKEWKAPDGDTLYLVGFANSDRISPEEQFGVSELPKDQPPTFLSVDQFSLLFAKPK